MITAVFFNEPNQAKRGVLGADEELEALDVGVGLGSLWPLVVTFHEHDAAARATEYRLTFHVLRPPVWLLLGLDFEFKEATFTEHVLVVVGAELGFVIAVGAFHIDISI